MNSVSYIGSKRKSDGNSQVRDGDEDRKIGGFRKVRRLQDLA